MENMAQGLYTYGCKIKIYGFRIIELINTTYFMYYLICRNKIKFRNFVICCVH